MILVQKCIYRLQITSTNTLMRLDKAHAQWCLSYFGDRFISFQRIFDKTDISTKPNKSNLLY